MCTRRPHLPPPHGLQHTYFQDVGQHVGLHMREEAQRLSGHLRSPGARSCKVALRQRNSGDGACNGCSSRMLLSQSARSARPTMASRLHAHACTGACSNTPPPSGQAAASHTRARMHRLVTHHPLHPCPTCTRARTLMPGSRCAYVSSSVSGTILHRS